jgi:succinate-acetate transporter protein
VSTHVRVPEARITPETSAKPAPGADIADPGPLGLACFALTTFVLCVFNSGLLEVEMKKVVLPLALIYGGFAQLLAGMWEFKKNNVFGATAFTSYGAFWMTYACYVWLVQPGIIEAAGTEGEHKARGLWLLAWTIFTIIMLVASMKTNKALFITFSVLTVTFILLTWGVYFEMKTIEEISGFLGIITAFCAWYTCMAGVCKSTFGRDVLPVGPIPK